MLLGESAMENPQVQVAADVMGRIGAAMDGQLVVLQKQVLDAISRLLVQAGGPVDAMVITGNTTMLYLLTGKDPTCLSCVPFEADTLFDTETRILETRTYLPPCMNAFVGADITCAVLASEMCEKETALLCDVGTNGEIALWKDGILYVTSTAAGPAFEGAGISCGSRAAAGAVDHYFADGGFSVIGGGTPQGICGSALVDFLAVERGKGTLDRFGRLTSGAKSVELAPGITITEEDIAELLKAKAAVSAAIKTLEQYCKEPLRRLKIAGGFARYLDPESARKIGLLPPCPALICGNLSLAGAAHCAATPEILEEMAGLSKKIREIHLNECPGFEANFTAGLLLL
jgi:uncharacterized 2Fe-2S/4Fe-4S cluster protein (DUF4445 family)